jgi:hypothetical protein
MAFKSAASQSNRAPLSVRLAAALAALCGIGLLLPGPKVGLLVLPGAWLLVGAIGLYRGRRDGAVGVLIVIVPGLLLFGDEFIEPANGSERLSAFIALLGLGYILIAIIYHWRRLSPFLIRK